MCWSTCTAESSVGPVVSGYTRENTPPSDAGDGLLPSAPRTAPESMSMSGSPSMSTAHWRASGCRSSVSVCESSPVSRSAVESVLARDRAPGSYSFILDRSGVPAETSTASLK